jgi:protoporphyrinogen oxidase
MLLILGAGPCGLGAAHHLEEAGAADWLVLEKNGYAGGLAASFTDPAGFTWDCGGHVLFSHFPDFDRAVDQVMAGHMLRHRRAAYVRFRSRWVPYPFQYHLHHLATDDAVRCLADLAQVPPRPDRAGFRTWIETVFGRGIADLFMVPYNEKLWAHPLDDMSPDWIAERVATLDFDRALRNALTRTDEDPWGPNADFAFPLRGGTGEIFRRMADRFPGRVRLGDAAVAVDLDARTVTTASGETLRWDHLVSTAPLQDLIAMADPVPADVREAVDGLAFNSLLVVGLAFERPTDHDKCWMYFPERSMPAYRVTNFGHYSAGNLPGGRDDRYAAYMCEIAFPAGEAGKTDPEPVIRALTGGLREAGLVHGGARPVSTWTLTVPRGYPVPTLDRDTRLAAVRTFLEGRGVLSRGRFGAYLYEAGNMDHSFMMGRQAAARILEGTPETLVPSL